MSYFSQMNDAHKNIKALLSELNKLALKPEENAQQIAKSISRLAGILKVHLSNEDRYLYPAMIKSSNAKLKEKAEAYQNEMGGLSEAFMAFKDNYNTSMSVTRNKDTATADITNMCKKIGERIQREDRDLYPLAKDVM